MDEYIDWTLLRAFDECLEVEDRANVPDPRKGWWESAQDGAEVRKVPKEFPAMGLPCGMSRQLPVGLAGALPDTLARRFGRSHRFEKEGST